ncbi:hypothetical protein AMTRI_Chr03g44010 [Amborella trichopoda]|uniref:Serine/threonine-protein phosphatase n=1 Tax=Amborella trichopoda TaxID=13333 RepID=W1PNC0_AMBTC|nr:serine/threonine-protein phosphatase 7 [Amborella trichopoda]ERN11532.1 hypothetical protein AMTR_s00022p00138420 [Amborella trichopoda]|eukprot:XP_006849951.1 serine/threonine-protein phosphatase 7 [Amborella trichopoda]
MCPTEKPPSLTEIPESSSSLSPLSLSTQNPSPVSLSTWNPPSVCPFSQSPPSASPSTNPSLPSDSNPSFSFCAQSPSPISLSAQNPPSVPLSAQNPSPTSLSTQNPPSNFLSSSSVSPAAQNKSLSSVPMPISWPAHGELTQGWIENLAFTFEWSSRNLSPHELPSLLPVSVFDSLVLGASKLLHGEPNCVKIEVGDAENCRVVVVGDVHGQLHDVLYLLRDAGPPSNERYFVFNGDYVDRGAWGLETFLLLLAWKVFLPHRVILLRGNHESKYCTSVYGFEQEVMTKYGNQGKHVYRKCLGCFEGLPLASVIANSVYTAHGGLFREMTITPLKKHKGRKRNKRLFSSEPKSLALGSLEELAKARRTVLNPPWEGPNLIPGDVLWSDPSNTPGLSPNTERGIGLLWGPDCTEQFLKKYKLKLIVRSHEGPDAREKRHGFSGMDKGYTIDHEVESGKLITLFSAPDYPQFQATDERYNNMGAYIVLEPPDFASPVFHSFEAVKPRPKVNAYYDYVEVVDSDEDLNLRSLKDD